MTVITNFRGIIGPSSVHKVEANRYILFASLGCPFAMRAVMARRLKGLEDVIEMCIVDYHYTDQGLRFTTSDKVKGCTPDPIMNAKYLRELYLKVCPEYGGIYSVPMIWDKKLSTIVNNESEDIMRMFNANMNELAKNPKLDLYPLKLKESIDEWNTKSMATIAKASREAGSATTQEEYEKNANIVKDSLLEMEKVLGNSKFIVGDELTEADIRLFNIVIRHDIFSTLLFRVNHIFVRDLSNTMRWIKDILDIPGMRQLVDIEHVKGMGYTKKAMNPSGIIPIGNGFVLPL